MYENLSIFGTGCCSPLTIFTNYSNFNLQTHQTEVIIGKGRGETECVKQTILASWWERQEQTLWIIFDETKYYN